MTGFRQWIGWAGLALLVVGALTAWSMPFTPMPGTMMLVAAALLLAAHLVWNWRRVRLFSRERTTRYGLNALLYTLAVAGILIVVNFLVVRNDVRWDSTAERFYSLSPQTRRVLEQLEWPVEALGFLQAGHPGRGRAEEILALMQSASGGRLTYRMIDPVTEPQEAVEHEVTRTLEIHFLSGEASSRATALTESALVNALLEATRGEPPVVCFSTGHGERSIDSSDQAGYLGVTDALRRERYAVTEVRILQTDDLPERCTVLVVPGPSQPFLEGEPERLREYLAAGGSLFLMLEPQVETGLEELAHDIGARLDDDQVVELNMAKGLGYLNPVGVSYDEEHAATRSLARNPVVTVFSNARSVEVSDRVVYRPEMETACLVQTASGQGSYAESEPGLIVLDPDEDRMGPICLGVATTIDPHEAPVLEGQVPPPADAPLQRMAVFGDADFATNLYLSMGANADLFLNVAGWLARRGELLEVRDPKRVPRTFVMQEAEMRMVLVVSAIGLPLVLLTGGALVWFRRRKL